MPQIEDRGGGKPALKEWSAPENKATAASKPKPAMERYRDQTVISNEQLAAPPTGPLAAGTFEPSPAEEQYEAEKASDSSQFLGLNSEAPTVRELSAAEYKALSPKQQSGVDFNTMLTKAVQADLKAAKAGGKVSSSKDYAPRTVRLLDSIGYKENDKVSLDDILQLKTAITESELGFLDLPEADYSGLGDGRREAEAPGSARVSVQQSLAKQLDTAFTKDRGGAGSMMAQRNELLGLPTVTGFGSGPEDAKFQEAFNLLAQTQSVGKQQELLPVLKQSLGSKEALARFWQYVDTRSQQAALKNQPLGTLDGATYLDPAAFRKIYVGGS